MTTYYKNDDAFNFEKQPENIPMTENETEVYNYLLAEILKADCLVEKQYAIERVESFLKATGLTTPELRNVVKK